MRPWNVAFGLMMWVLVLWPSAAAAGDDCAGGSDAPGGTWWAQHAWTTISNGGYCEGSFGQWEGLGSGGDGDEYDWYAIEAPEYVGTTTLTIYVTVCATIDDPYGTIGFLVWFHDALSKALSDAQPAGHPPLLLTPLPYSPSTANGHCETQTYAISNPVPGGRAYIRVGEGYGSCCPVTTGSYSLDVALIVS